MNALHRTRCHERDTVPLCRTLVRRTIIMGVLPMIVFGCGGDRARESDALSAEARPIERRAERGPVTLVLEVDRKQIDISRRLRLHVEIVAEKGVTIRPGEYGASLAEGDRRFQFRAVEVASEERRPTQDGRLRWAYDYEIEFVLPGEYELPPATVAFLDLRETKDGALPSSDNSAGSRASLDEEELTTETITITVTAPQSAVPSEEELLTVAAPDPVELPRPWKRWAAVAVPVVAILIVATILLIRRLRRQRILAAIIVPAHQWADLRLDELAATNLVATGEFQQFYYRVCDIVRGYCERRYRVAAPEMTTDEFLATIAKDAQFSQAHRELLIDFLCACDMVKYAGHTPKTDECDGAMNAARDYVRVTRERDGDGAVDRAEHSAGLGTSTKERAA